VRDRLPPAVALIALLSLVALPVATYGVVGGAFAGLGIAYDLALVWIGVLALGRVVGRERLAGVLVGALWAAAVVYGLALAGSRLATDAELPLYDLTLLVRPLIVVGADLWGPVVYALGLCALVLPLPLWVLGSWLSRAAAHMPPRFALLGAFVLAWLPGSRSMVPGMATDLSRSWNMAADFNAERASRPHDDLRDLMLPASPDVHIYVIESYGEVMRTLVSSGRWRALLMRLDTQVKANGWYTASGVAEAPVHGGRSWISDSSALTGLFVDSQSNYERVTALAPSLLTMPSFFADRGYRTILVRPTDRARPGILLQNRFAFEETVFFDDLHYTGPVLGWGHIPDQYTLHVAHREVIDPGDAPTFAFFHLATSHMPWAYKATLYDDPMEALLADGSQATIMAPRTPYQELRVQLRRFAGGDGTKGGDRMHEQRAYADAVFYDLEAVVRQVGAVDPKRPRMVVFYGDHQPPFLARGTRPDVPVHVMASDPAMLAPFLDHGFEPGLYDAEGAATMQLRDLFPAVAHGASQAK
jgi:hypothetical protein